MRIQQITYTGFLYSALYKPEYQKESGAGENGIMLSKEMLLDAYEIKIAQMHADDIPSLHELSMAVRWPHRATDWAELMQMGEGYVARDQIGRLICSMMWFPFGEHYASVGMGISSPRLQERGAGRWLAEHIQQKIGNRNVFLNATKDSLRLCLSFSFDTVQPVFHHKGQVTSVPSAPGHAVRMQQCDYDAIEKLDEAAMGFNRDRVIKHLLSISDGYVIRTNGDIKGFALCRKFGRGHVIGPVIAESEETAIALISPFINEHSDGFLRMDTYQDEGLLRNYLVDAGLKHHETVTKMSRGDLPSPTGITQTMGLASQALG